MTIERHICICGNPLKKNAKKYCSPACYVKNRIVWNKGQYGKTDRYRTLHYQIAARFGKATICRKCKSLDSVTWSNISGEYNTERSDWEELCSSCHKQYDLEHPAKVKLIRNNRRAVC